MNNAILVSKRGFAICAVAIGALDYLVGLGIQIIYLGLHLIITRSKCSSASLSSAIVALDCIGGKI